MAGNLVWLHQEPQLREHHWRHGWTDARGPDFGAPVDATAQNQAVAALMTAVGISGAAWAQQVHGGTVRYVEQPGLAGDADALWTDRPGLGVVGRSADCPLVLVGGLRSDGSAAWGFAHASWRSTMHGISSGLVNALTNAGADPATLVACLCPSAGPCCYEVGPEVRHEAVARLGATAAGFFDTVDGRLVFDLWAANRYQLQAGGVLPAHISCVGICTICGGEIWPSYRRQGALAGRFAAVIGR